MQTGADLDELKALASGRPANENVAELYRRAFKVHGAEALWNRRPSETPTFGQALVVADSLRREGDLRCRALAEAIENACRAAL